MRLLSVLNIKLKTLALLNFKRSIYIPRYIHFIKTDSFFRILAWLQVRYGRTVRVQKINFYGNVHFGVPETKNVGFRVCLSVCGQILRLKPQNLFWEKSHNIIHILVNIICARKIILKLFENLHLYLDFKPLKIRF